MSETSEKRGEEPLRYLRDWRADCGLTQEELARRAGVAVATIRRAEYGEGTNPINAVKLAWALGISVQRLRTVNPAELPPMERR